MHHKDTKTAGRTGSRQRGVRPPTGVRWIAEIAAQVNERTENVVAQRLHTVMESLLETVSYAASEMSGQMLTIDANYVNDGLGKERPYE